MPLVFTDFSVRNNQIPYRDVYHHYKTWKYDFLGRTF